MSVLDFAGWRARAACRQSPPSLFDPREQHETTRAFRLRVQEASRICEQCTVAPECLITAARCRDDGVRAGFLLAGGRQQHSLLFPHGTTAAYARHIRHHDKPCKACRDAYTEDRRAS